MARGSRMSGPVISLRLASPPGEVPPHPMKRIDAAIGKNALVAVMAGLLDVREAVGDQMRRKVTVWPASTFTLVMHLPAYLSEDDAQMPLTANSTATGLLKLTLTPGVSFATTPALLRAIVRAIRAPHSFWSGLTIGSVECRRNFANAVSSRSPSMVWTPSYARTLGWWYIAGSRFPCSR